MIASAATATIDFITSRFVLVKGDSMVPTLRDGQRKRISRWAYRSNDPRRWDIVLFEHPRQPGFWEVKRVVGLPGEAVQLKRGALIVNSVLIPDLFYQQDSSPAEYRWKLRSYEYIVIGDNRNRSSDSRTFGPVKRSAILGKAILKPLR